MRTILAFLLLTAVAPAQMPELAQTILDIFDVPMPTLPAVNTPRRLHSHSDAVALAAADAASLPHPEHCRYVWIPDGNADDRALVSFVCNSVLSRSDQNWPPGIPGSPIQFLADGRLVRLDFSILCPRRKGQDQIDALKVWDAMRNPYFLTDETGRVDALEHIQFVLRIGSRAANIRADGQVVGVCPAGSSHDVLLRMDSDGHPWAKVSYGGATGWVLLGENAVIEERRIREGVGFQVRTWGSHIDLASGAALQAATLSENPIVWCRTLYHEALTQADGGSYYAFMGIQRSSGSDFDAMLRGFGLSEEAIKDLRADQRGLLTISAVTGKPRRVDVFDRPARPGVSQGLVSVTQDPLDGAERDPAKDPWMNLLEFTAGGTEVIFERNNGHLAYVLFDGAGELVDEAPPNLVSDHLIPEPHTRRLQPAISCIRCHGTAAADGGWKPFTSEVRAILGSVLDVADDTAGVSSGLNLEETRERLQALYLDRLDKVFRRAREDQSDAIVVSALPANAGGRPWQYADVSQAMSQRFTRHLYTPVTAEIACEEIGLAVPAGSDPAAVLTAALGASALSDIRLTLLCQGLAITRAQWEQVFEDAASATINGGER